MCFWMENSSPKMVVKEKTWDLNILIYQDVGQLKAKFLVFLEIPFMIYMLFMVLNGKQQQS